MAVREDVLAAQPLTTTVAGVAVTGWLPARAGEREYFWVLWLLLPGLAAAGIIAELLAEVGWACR